MKLEDLKNLTATKDLPLGTSKVVFDKIQYRIDQETKDIIGAFVHIKDYSSLYIPVFEEDNFQLNLLIKQLGAKNATPDEINKCSSKEITVTRYERGEYVNVSFNPNSITSESIHG